MHNHYVTMYFFSHRLPGKKCLENQILLTVLTVFGNILQSVSTCGKPFAILLPQPCVEFQLPLAGDVILPVWHSNISGISLRPSGLWQLNALFTRECAASFWVVVVTPAVNQWANFSWHSRRNRCASCQRYGFVYFT